MIAAEGPLGVDRYMGLCLGHARHGYYMRQDPLGSAGDFTTAPEISQMFGELIGVWCAAAWQALGAPSPLRLVELGPGRGTLAIPGQRAGDRLTKQLWWTGVDSNHRTLARADLQSAAFNHSATCPPESRMRENPRFGGTWRVPRPRRRHMAMRRLPVNSAAGRERHGQED